MKGEEGWKAGPESLRGNRLLCTAYGASPLHLFPLLPISWSTWLAREVNNHQKSQCLSRAAALCAPTRASDANMTPARLYYELLELLHRRRIFTCSVAAAPVCRRPFIETFSRFFRLFACFLFEIINFHGENSVCVWYTVVLFHYYYSPVD